MCYVFFGCVNAKGELEMQKFHGVGKFFNEWWADRLLPKKEILVRKRKYHTEKGSLTKKHKKVLLNLRKNIVSRELTCQLKIIT